MARSVHGGTTASAPGVLPPAHSPVVLGLLLGFVAGASGLGLAAAPVVLPDLATDLGLATAQTAWVLSGFSIALAVITPVLGRLTDQRGAQLTLLVAVACTAIGSLLVVLAPTFVTLIAGRLLQGAGAAGLSITAFGIAGHRLEGAQRAQALGILTALSSLFLGSGPLIGAATESLLGWRGALALPVIAVLAVGPMLRLAAPVLLPAAGGIDLGGALLVLAAAGGVMALLQARANGMAPPLMLTIGALVVVTALALRRHVRAHPRGFLPGSLLANHGFLLLSASASALMGGFLGMGFLAPLLLIDGRDWSALQVGAALLPAAAAAAAAAHLVGTLRPRVAAEPILVALGLAAAAGLALAGIGSDVAALVVLGAAATTAGFAGAQVVLLDRVSELVGADDRGVALGIFNLIFVIGGAMGAALAGALADAASLRAATASIALLPALAIPLALAARGRTA